MTARQVPSALRESYDRLSSPGPLDALASSHALHRGLARWQIALVKEALAEKASWDDIGAAIDTTRQGAWARFRVTLEEGEGGKEMDHRRQNRQQIVEMWNAGHARLRELEAKWIEEQSTLRQQVERSKDQLMEAKRRHQRERRDAKQRLRREIREARI